MNNIKIAFFDIDGTLLKFHEKHLREKVIEALLGLRKKGVMLCIATGRSPMALPSFPEIEFDAYVTFNGSYCFDKNGVIFSNPIEHGEVLKLVDNANKINRPVCIATHDRLAANGIDQDLEDYFKFSHAKLEVSDDFDELLKQDIYQIMMGGYEQEYPLIMQDVKGAKLAAWWHRAVDIIPSNGGKGIAISKMLEYYNLDKSQAIAFGDGNNDIEMLEAVGTGIAMANGSDKLKAIATQICKDVQDDGIYYYCLEHGLIEG